VQIAEASRRLPRKITALGLSFHALRPEIAMDDQEFRAPDRKQPARP